MGSMRWKYQRSQEAYHKSSFISWPYWFAQHCFDKSLIPGFSLRLPLYHQDRRFRIIVNVPNATNVDSNGEFKYGRLEGETPTLEEFNRLVKNTAGKDYAEVTDPTWLT